MDELREMQIEATGVVKIEYDTITVNSINMIGALREQLETLPIARDYNGAFAARVKIELELLGDWEKTEEGR